MQRSYLSKASFSYCPQDLEVVEIHCGGKNYLYEIQKYKLVLLVVLQSLSGSNVHLISRWIYKSAGVWLHHQLWTCNEVSCIRSRCL